MVLWFYGISSLTEIPQRQNTTTPIHLQISIDKILKFLSNESNCSGR